MVPVPEPKSSASPSTIGDDRSHAEHLGQRGSRLSPPGSQLLFHLAQLGVSNAAQVLQEVGGQLPAGQRDRARRNGLLQQAARVAAVISFCTPPGTSSHITACSVARATWLRDRARSRCSHTCRIAAVVIGYLAAAVRAQRGEYDRPGVVRVGLVPVSPAANSRTRAASLGCTSRTRSPAATSCWATRWPRPAAPSPPRCAPATPPPIRLAAQPAGAAPTREMRPAAAHRCPRPPPCAIPCAGPHDHHCRHGTALSRACGPRKRAAGMPCPTGPEGARALFRTTPRQESGEPAPRSLKPDHRGKRAVREPGLSDPLNATVHNRNAYPKFFNKAARVHPAHRVP